MFEPLPVRRGEFRRNIKKQFNKLLRGMQAYALISLGVRITVTNTKAKGGKQTHIGTQVGFANQSSIVTIVTDLPVRRPRQRHPKQTV